MITHPDLLTTGEVARLIGCAPRTVAKFAITPDYAQEVPSYRHVKRVIQQRYMIELKGVPFDKKSLDLVQDAGSCEACPKRVGNLQREEPEEYEGLRADVCTDPDCCKLKTAAWQKATVAEAKASGQKILSEKESKQVFPYGDSPCHDSPYLDLAATCYEDKKHRSYDQILKKSLDPGQVVLCFDAGDRLHRLVPKTVASVLLKELGIGKDSSSSGFSRNGHSSEADKAERAKRIEDGRVRRETNREMLARAYQSAEKLFKFVPAGNICVNQVLRALAHDLAGHVCHGADSAGESICRRRGTPALRAQEQREAIEKLIVAADGPQLAALVVELSAGRNLIGYGGGRDKDLATALGLPTRPALEKEVAKRLKEEKAHKSNGKAHANGKARPKPSYKGETNAERMAQDSDPRTIGVEDLGLPEFIETALIRSGLKTIGDLQDLSIETGKPLALALTELAGLTKAGAKQIAEVVIGVLNNLPGEHQDEDPEPAWAGEDGAEE